MNQKQDDKELLDLFITLWRGKIILIGFIITSILIGYSLFLYEKNNIVTKEPYYESKLHFSMDLQLPRNLQSTWENLNNISEYQKLFYSEDFFQNWKDENLQFNITSDDFKDTKNIAGSYITKSPNLYIKFSSRNDDQFILIQSKYIPIFDEILSYAEYISEKFDNSIYLKFLDLYEKVDEKFTEFNDNYGDSASSDFIYEQIKILNFLDKIDDGNKFINIIGLDNPKNINPSAPSKEFSYLRILVFAIFGGMLGSIFLLIRSVFSN
jgi:hypothetical protein